MMNNPLFRNYTTQQPSRHFRSVPVQQTQQKPSPKVISVPVHFISSNQPPTTISMSKDSAAVKIQKVFRGFVVRKSVKKIVSIRNKVVEIERRIEDSEVVDLIRRDQKERLRVNETLMSLLFKLDSIRGVDCGIRDLRKAVTKKAIALQEKVDSIGQVDHQTIDSDSNDKIDHINVCSSTLDQVTEASKSVDENNVEKHVNLEAVGDNDNDRAVKEDVKDEDVTREVEAMETSSVENVKDVQEPKEDRAIIEDLMDDNEKLRRLMSQITERNEMQTRMINCLSRRVEQLEKAEKQRKKKKTHVPLRRRMRDMDSLCI